MNEPTEIPPSASLCRGQADHGIGEPDAPIRRGEQYLAADPVLAGDPVLLRALRPWLTLDAAPGDSGRLGERLTGWACFPAGPWQFVVRLAAAGRHDRRDAYFAHARAWPLADCPADFDPGLYLGEDGAFLAAAPAPGAALPDGGLPPPAPAALGPVLADPGLARALIAHLFHGMLAGLPVILAVPLTAFAAGAPLARTIACARGALPGRLRRRCRVRVFTRNPGLFLGTEGGTGGGTAGAVDLLVIPEDLAAAALAAVRRRALLLDGQGERRDGPAPAPGLDDYAEGVIAAARRLPDHLTRFGERFDTHWQDPDRPPGADLTAWVALTYNLAAALAGGPASCGSLLGGFLLPQARANPGVPWGTLIGPADWARFPREALVRVLLRADDDLTAGERALQRALADAFQTLGASVDEGLPAWWDPADPARRRRLLELADLNPPLVSAAACAALTAGLKIADLAAGGGPLAGVLRAELATGALRARRPEAADLLARLDQPGVFEVLSATDRAGLLPAPWGSGDLAALPVAPAAALLRRVLADAARTDPDDLVRRLIARLMADPSGLKAVVAELFDAAGRLRATVTAPLAALLLATPALAGRLHCADLLELGARLPAEAGPALAGYYRRLDARMDEAPADSTEALIRHGAWLAWRRQAGARLGPADRHRLALTWLTSPALAVLRTDGARIRPPQWRVPGAADPDPAGRAPLPDVTRETWDQVMADLGALTPAEARLLCEPRTRWPWLYPFQADQVRDLAARCRTPETEALLLGTLAAPGAEPDPELAAAAAGPWVAGVIAALAEGAAADAFDTLRRRVRASADRVGHPAAHHPLLRLAEGLRGLPADQRRPGAPLIGTGRSVLARLMVEEPACHRRLAAGARGARLPLLHLAAALAPERQPGTLALWFIHQPACAGPSADPGWWEALLGSLLALTTPAGDGPHRRPGEPAPAEATRAAALALIDAEHARLTPAAALALDRAWAGLGLGLGLGPAPGPAPGPASDRPPPPDGDLPP